jgi:hypothetical protein
VIKIKISFSGKKARRYKTGSRAVVLRLFEKISNIKSQITNNTYITISKTPYDNRLVFDN